MQDRADTGGELETFEASPMDVASTQEPAEGSPVNTIAGTGHEDGSGLSTLPSSDLGATEQTPEDSVSGEPQSGSSSVQEAEPHPTEPLPQELASAISKQAERLEKMGGLLATFQERLTATEEAQASMAQFFRQIEHRLQELSADGVSLAKRSLLSDVMALHDLVVSMGQTIDPREEIPVDEFRQRISLVAVQIAQMLQLHGLQPISAEPGDLFDPKLHYAREGVACETSDMHRTIKAVHRIGFRGGAHVFRPAAVDVWVWKDSGGQASEPESAEDDPEAPAKPPEVVSDGGPPALGDEPSTLVESDTKTDSTVAPACPEASPEEGQTDRT